MGKYYLGLQSGSQTNFSVVDGSGVVSDLDLSGLYLSVTGKAADSDLLDGQDSAYYRDISNITGTLRLSGYFTGDFTGYARVDAIQFNTGTTGAGTTPVGELEWADDLGTLKLGLRGGNITHYIGQQLFERVVNKTTGTLAKGTVVYVTGAQGNRIKVEPAIASGDYTSATVIGVVAETIPVDAEGFVTQDGILQGLNTTGFAEGAVLWLSPTIPGAITTTKPLAPEHLVMVGFCVRSHQSAGEIAVKIQNGYELDELHNVRLTGVNNGQILAYNTASGVWYNANLTGGANISVTSTGSSNITIATTSGSYTGTFVGTASNAELLDNQDSSYYLNIANITGALTSGQSLLIGDGSGRFANAVVGSGLLLTGGTLHATGAGGDANTLNGLSGSFYRDAGNLTGTLFVEITGTVPNSEKLNGESGSYYLNYANFTGTANASGTFSGIFRSNASTTGTAAVNLPHGIAPASPVDGDLWTTNSGLYVQISGSTVGPLSTGTAGGGGTIVDVFTGSATWTKPTGAVYIDVICIGGGGGGGSGRKGTGTTGGGTGGGGGALSRMGFSASLIGSTETVTVGAGGPGGASRTTNDTNGQAGTNGGTSSFGTWLRAGGGRGGNEGIAGANNGVSGGGAINVASPISNSVDAIGGQAAPGGAGLSFNAEYGGGAGAASTGASTGAAGGSSIYGGPGGGSGGGISGTTAFAGGAGGNTGAYTPGGGGAAGGIGANGSNGASPSRSNCGTGAGGGGGSRTGNAGSGGTGGTGAGGGGGGAALNDVGNSGAGGSGGSGRVIVITYK